MMQVPVKATTKRGGGGSGGEERRKGVPWTEVSRRKKVYMLASNN